MKMRNKVEMYLAKDGKGGRGYMLYVEPENVERIRKDGVSKEWPQQSISTDLHLCGRMLERAYPKLKKIRNGSRPVEVVMTLEIKEVRP